MQDQPAPWRPHPGGLAVALRVQPRAQRAGVGGAVPDAAGPPRLRVAVTEPPEDGQATRAARAVLAAALDVPAWDVTVQRGAGAREKLLLAVGGPAAQRRPRRAWGAARLTCRPAAGPFRATRRPKEPQPCP